MKTFEQIESDASAWEDAPEAFPGLDAKTNRAIAETVTAIDDLYAPLSGSLFGGQEGRDWADKVDWAAEKSWDSGGRASSNE